MLNYATYKAQEQPRQVKTYKAALYIRLSKDDGDKTESDSVFNQRRILSSYVHNHPDIDLVDYYIDDGFIGANFNRPDFIRMMDDIYGGKVDCVIVKDSSRFARNAAENGRYLGEVFPKLGVRFIAINDAIDTGNSQSVATDFINYSVRGMLNEYYLASNSVNIRSTLDMERQKGEFIGSFAKYGYKKDPNDHHKLLIDGEAAEIVRMIYRMYLSGTGIRGIVRYLNNNGIPNPSTYKQLHGMNFQSRSIGNSSLWSDKTVRRTLKDEMYIGNMVQGKHRKVTYKDKLVKPVPKDQWIRVEATHEPIISPEDFDRAQRLLSTGAKGSVKGGGIDLFAGFLRCADCGHAMIKKTNHNPDKTYIYYRCSTHCKCKVACDAHTIRYEKLYDTVLTAIKKMIDVAVQADEVLKEIKDHRSDAGNHIEMQLNAQYRKLNDVKNILADLYPDFKSGLLNQDQYLVNKEKYEREQEQLAKSIENLRSMLNKEADTDTSNEFIEHFKRRGNIDRLSRPLLCELIDHITVSQDGSLEIAFNFTDAFQDTQMILKKDPPSQNELPTLTA